MKLRITIDGRTYAADVEVLEEDDDLSGSVPHDLEPIPAPGAYKPAQPADGQSLDEKIYRSPVTGLVIRSNVKLGQMVRAGEVLLVLEAMKMETSVLAHCAGRVKNVHAATGESVKLHQVLVELE